MIKHLFFIMLLFIFLSSNCYADGITTSIADCNSFEHKGIKYYKNLIDKDTDNVCTYYYLAKEYYRKHKIQDFLNTLDTITYINPKDKYVYIFRAYIYDIYNNNDKFFREHARAIKEIPDFEQGHYHVAYAYQTLLFDYENALKHINIAIQLSNGKDAHYYYIRGNIYNDMEKYEEAIKDYTRSIELKPNNELSYYFRSDCYEKIGKTKEAEADKQIYQALQNNNKEKRTLAEEISIKFYPLRQKLFYTKTLW